MSNSMGFIDSSWPRPLYLKRISSHEKFMKLKKIKHGPIFFKNNEIVDNKLINNEIVDNKLINNTNLISNYTNPILPRNPVQYSVDHVCLCIMIWLYILGGVKNFLLRQFNYNGTRY